MKKKRGKEDKMIIVAGYDSSEEDRLKAQYVCDGFLDDETVQQAIGELDRRLSA